MKAKHLAAIALALLLAPGAAAQDHEPTPEEQIAEMKASHTAALMSLLANPDVTKRTPEYKALRDEWTLLRDQLRHLESDLERNRRMQQINEDWHWEPPPE
jgi:hypothetical protein